MTSVTEGQPRVENAPARADDGPARAAGMRQAMADFVLAVHRSYLNQVRLLPPAAQAAMPLLAADRITVVAAAAGNLHVLATTAALPAVSGPQVELTGRIDPLHWQLRFYDPVVLPGLGLVDERAGSRPEQVRHLLGVDTVLYHLVVQPGSELTAHHAAHLGAGLAGSHTATHRALERLRDQVGRRAPLVDELAGALAAGLPGAAVLLAAALAPGEPELADRARRVARGGQLSPSGPGGAFGSELIELVLTHTRRSA